jgi:hypothetical protein
MGKRWILCYETLRYVRGNEVWIPQYKAFPDGQEARVRRYVDFLSRLRHYRNVRVDQIPWHRR